MYNWYLIQTLGSFFHRKQCPKLTNPKLLALNPIICGGGDGVGIQYGVSQTWGLLGSPRITINYSKYVGVNLRPPLMKSPILEAKERDRHALPCEESLSSEIVLADVVVRCCRHASSPSSPAHSASQP